MTQPPAGPPPGPPPGPSGRPPSGPPPSGPPPSGRPPTRPSYPDWTQPMPQQAGPPPGPPGAPPPYWTSGGSGSGGPGRPPRRTGLIVALAALAVAIVAAFCITAFVAPGFLVGDENTSASDNASASSSPEPSSSGGVSEVDRSDPRAVMVAVEQGLVGHDQTGLADLACADAADVVGQSTDAADEVEDAQLGDSVDASETQASAPISVTVGGDAIDFEVVVADADGSWCWQNFTAAGPASTSPPSTLPPAPSASASASPVPLPTDGPGVDPAGESVGKDFISAINAGDPAGAKALLCPDARSNDILVDGAIDGKAQLKLVVDDSISGYGSVLADLSGTLDGAEVKDSGLVVSNTTGNWCVTAFYAF